MPNPRRRRRRPSPLQKPFEPGTQDNDAPLTTPVVVVGPSSNPEETTPTNPRGPRTRARTHTGAMFPKTPGCAGPGWEDRDFQHAEAIDLVLHLEIFFSHTWAVRFVEEFGREMINLALREITSWRGVNMPAAFLVNRVRTLSQGALPLVDPPDRRPATDPESYIKEYVRRRGHMPGEAP